MQYERKVSGGTQPSLVDAGFGLTSVLTIQIYWWKILILGVKPCAEVQLVVGNFVYLADGICPDGGCDLAIIKRCCSAWIKFR